MKCMSAWSVVRDSLWARRVKNLHFKKEFFFLQIIILIATLKRLHLICCEFITTNFLRLSHYVNLKKCFQLVSWLNGHREDTVWIFCHIGYITDTSKDNQVREKQNALKQHKMHFYFHWLGEWREQWSTLSSDLRK